MGISDKKWDAAKSFIFDAIRSEKYPDRLAVFLLSEDELHQLFTRERLRIVKALKDKAFSSVTELSEFLGRDKAAVTRDLRLLKEHGLVRFEKMGRRLKPVLDKDGIYLPLAEPRPILQI